MDGLVTETRHSGLQVLVASSLFVRLMRRQRGGHPRPATAAPLAKRTRG